MQGFDLSPALIDSARSRKRSDERAIAFEIADMATAIAPEEPYDRLASRFGIMFFDDPLAALANLARWLAPGGRSAFAVWGRPTENPWMTSVRQVVGEIIDFRHPIPKRLGHSAMLMPISCSPCSIGPVMPSSMWATGVECSRSAVGCEPRRRRISHSHPFLHSASCLPKQATRRLIMSANH